MIAKRPQSEVILVLQEAWLQDYKDPRLQSASALRIMAGEVVEYHLFSYGIVSRENSDG